MPGKYNALFWIAGPVPTDEERAAAKVLGITAFRNAVHADTAALERAEVVAGMFPEGYRRMDGCRVVEAAPKAPEKQPEPDPPPAQPLPAQSRKAGR